jgi:hypothetical protein
VSHTWETSLRIVDLCGVAEVVVCSVHDRGKENSLGGHKKNLEVVAKVGSRYEGT